MIICIKILMSRTDLVVMVSAAKDGGHPGIEPGTSRNDASGVTLSENHTTRPAALFDLLMPSTTTRPYNRVGIYQSFQVWLKKLGFPQPPPCSPKA